MYHNDYITSDKKIQHPLIYLDFDFQILRAMSDYNRQTLCSFIQKLPADEIELFALLYVARHIGILSAAYTHSLCIIFFVLYSPLLFARAKTRGIHHLPRLSIAEALSAVIGPWCRTMGQTMHGTIHPLLLDYPALSHPGHPPPPPTHRRRLLSWNQHIPANLINIIADYAAPWSQWELRAKRYQRYEAPALCALLFPISPSLSPSFPAERIICRRAVAHLPFTKKLLRKKKRKERDLCYLNDERRRDSLPVVIRWCGVTREIISNELFFQWYSLNHTVP